MTLMVNIQDNKLSPLIKEGGLKLKEVIQGDDLERCKNQ